MNRENKGLLICWVVVVGLMLSTAFHYCIGRFFHLGWPYNTFLFKPEDSWNDFFTYFSAMRLGKPFSLRGNVYFPFMYVLLYLILGFKPMSAFAVLVFSFLGFSIFFVRTRLFDLPTYSRRLIVSILVFTSYPMLFCLDRGNLEMVVFIFLALFIFFYQRGAVCLSILFLSAAGAIKIYPLVFGVLLIADRKYKQVAQTAIITLLLLLLPAAFLPEGFRTSLLDLGSNLHILQKQLKAGEVGLTYCTSIFSVLMNLGHLLLKKPFPDIYVIIEWIYPAVCVLFFAGLIFYLVRVETSYWRRLTFLTFVMLLFPQVSNDYKLIHLLIPITAFIAAPSENRASDQYGSWLFGLLLIPKAYYFVSPGVHLGVFINPLLMCVFMGLMFIDRFREMEASALL